MWKTVVISEWLGHGAFSSCYFNFLNHVLLLLLKHIYTVGTWGGKQLVNDFFEGFYLQKFLFIFLFIRAIRSSKWVLRQSKAPIPAIWTSRIKRTKWWRFLISAAPPWCGFGETGWLDNTGVSLAGGIPSTSVTTWNKQ